MLDIVISKLSLRFSQVPDDSELSKELCRRYSSDGQTANLEDVFMLLSGKRLEQDGEEGSE